MERTIPISESARADDPEQDRVRDDETHEVAPDIAYKRLMMVNVVFVGPPLAGDREWALVDAGLAGTAGAIIDAAEDRFGKESRPAAILLTHGHFDHVGALDELADRWTVPIYAHEAEMPFLDGTRSYPPPDPSVGGGMMAWLSPLYPRGPIDVSKWLLPLPSDGGVPGLADWRWLHTPGHTEGHVSFWRGADHALIAGDAFITTNQESAYAVMTQRLELHGPPMYFTPDWESAKESVQHLAGLEPDLVVTGHGRAMRGPEMLAALQTLALDFDRIAVPEQGRYVPEEKERRAA